MNTIEELAAAYAETIYGRPDGWGQYCHPTLGVSHDIMRRMFTTFGTDESNKAIDAAMADYRATHKLEGE